MAKSEFVEIVERNVVLIYVDPKGGGRPMLHICCKQGDRGPEHQSSLFKASLRKVNITNCGREFEWVRVPLVSFFHPTTYLLSALEEKWHYRICQRCGDDETWLQAIAEIREREEVEAGLRAMDEAEREGERNWDMMWDGVLENCLKAAREDYPHAIVAAFGPSISSGTLGDMTIADILQVFGKWEKF